jgi:tetratricopeptide (TPR) repeat protein
VRVPAAASDGGARLRSPPSPASLFLAEGQFSLQHGRYDLAERLLEQGAAAAARPGEAELFCGLAAFARGRYERAAEHWIASCERDPRLFCRGPSLRAALPSNEELLSRSQDLRRHLSWQPGDPQALFVAARVELEVGDLRGSLRWVQSLRQVAPEHPFLRLLEEELASRLRSK